MRWPALKRCVLQLLVKKALCRLSPTSCSAAAVLELQTCLTLTISTVLCGRKRLKVPTFGIWEVCFYESYHPAMWDFIIISDFFVLSSTHQEQQIRHSSGAYLNHRRRKIFFNPLSSFWMLCIFFPLWLLVWFMQGIPQTVPFKWYIVCWFVRYILLSARFFVVNLLEYHWPWGQAGMSSLNSAVTVCPPFVTFIWYRNKTRFLWDRLPNVLETQIRKTSVIRSSFVQAMGIERVEREIKKESQHVTAKIQVKRSNRHWAIERFAIGEAID